MKGRAPPETVDSGLEGSREELRRRNSAPAKPYDAGRESSLPTLPPKGVQMPLLLPLLLGSLVTATPPPPIPSHAIGAACSRAKSARARRNAEGAPLQPTDLSPDPTATASDVLHYRLVLEIDPTITRIVGSNVMTIRAENAEGLGRFRFRLDQRLHLGSVTSAGRRVTPTRIDADTIEVAIDPPVPSGESFDLSVAWDGTPISSDLGGFLFDTHRGTPFVWTLSEPYGSSTWWACKDDNRDKATLDFDVVVPSALTVVSNGRLEGVDDAGGGRRRWKWREGYPIAPYLVSLSATKYNVHERTFDRDGVTMPVTFHIFPDEDSASTRAKCDRVVDMLGTYSEIFGTYPFLDEKYEIYQFGFGGGMEHQTATGQVSFSEGLSCHELAHQWWGDMVTCATWHDIWLNEGFATYAEALWYEAEAGADGREVLLQTMDEYRPRSSAGTVWVDDISDVNRIFDGDLSYLKGSWVLHMLRKVVGDEPFFRILREWRAAYQFDSGTTEEFRAIAEMVAGRDLGWFFDEWVYGAGGPSYRWGWRPVEAAGRNYVEVDLRQVQSGSWPTFTGPVDLFVFDSAGSRIVTVWNDTRAEHLLVETEGVPSYVDLDPEGWILTTSLATTPFAFGPPKIVDSSPEPGARLPQGEPAALVVRFHDAIVLPDNTVQLVGPDGLAVAATTSLDATFRDLTVTPAAPLRPGRWILRIADSVTARSGGKALDGEISGTNPTFPSGDGLPGGSAEIPFRVMTAADSREGWPER
jgi:methionine-rich copper-binding protein CopC